MIRSTPTELLSVTAVMIHPVFRTQRLWPVRVAPCNGESSAPDQFLAVVVRRLLPRTTTPPPPTAPGTEECAVAATITTRGVLIVAAAWLLCIIVAAVTSCGGEARIPCILYRVRCSNGPSLWSVVCGSRLLFAVLPYNVRYCELVLRCCVLWSLCLDEAERGYL
jgi:hypothetical protein